jgi:hypothetical protein
MFWLFLVLCPAGQVMAFQTQFSMGADFNLGYFTADLKPGFLFDGYFFLLDEHRVDSFFAPGISFKLRLFPDTVDHELSPIGSYLRFGAALGNTLEQTGQVNIKSNHPGIPKSLKIAEKYSLSGDSYLYLVYFGVGSSQRYDATDWLYLYGDVGFNGFFMGYDLLGEGSEYLRYMSVGMSSDLAAQFALGKKWYLEIGVDFLLSLFSSQKGQVKADTWFEYEDTGESDFVSISPYIHIGWKWDILPNPAASSP